MVGHKELNIQKSYGHLFRLFITNSCWEDWNYLRLPIIKLTKKKTNLILKTKFMVCLCVLQNIPFLLKAGSIIVLGLDTIFFLLYRIYISRTKKRVLPIYVYIVLTSYLQMSETYFCISEKTNFRRSFTFTKKKNE